MTQQEEALFQQRLARHRDELRWLYMELYDNGPMFDALCSQMHGYAETRAAALKAGTPPGRPIRTGTSGTTCWG